MEKIVASGKIRVGHPDLMQIECKMVPLLTSKFALRWVG